MHVCVCNQIMADICVHFSVSLCVLLCLCVFFACLDSFVCLALQCLLSSGCVNTIKQTCDES